MTADMRKRAEEIRVETCNHKLSKGSMLCECRIEIASAILRVERETITAILDLIENQGTAEQGYRYASGEKIADGIRQKFLSQEPS